MSVNSGSASKRRDQDVVKLMMSKYKVEMKEDDGRVGFQVEFCGPKGTPYEDGVWQIRVELPQDYPFRSPSIGFQNRIFHPNVDEHSGSVCLDVINQLLTYPNPSDPLNGEAAALMMRDPKAFEKRVRDSIQRHASSQRTSPVLSPSSTPTTTSSGKSKLSKPASSERDDDEMSVMSENNDHTSDDLLADMEL